MDNALDEASGPDRRLGGMPRLSGTGHDEGEWHGLNSGLDQASELGRSRVEQNRSSNERESVGEKAGRSCFALTWATVTAR
jgi:hypothetical protein